MGSETPAGLGETGLALWNGTLAEREDGSRLELRADELALLAEACRMADDAAAIRAELVGEPWTVDGSKGQRVTHPLRAELHRTVGTLDRLLRTLALPDEDGTSASVAGRQLVRQRWGA